MSVIHGLAHSSGVDTGDIPAALRLRSAASAFLYKTLPSASGATKSALSMWVKRGKLGSYQSLFVVGGDSSNYGELYFSVSDALVLFANVGGSTVLQKISSALFRDTSSHYHIFVAVDTTLATAEDRFQIWVNGTRVTSFSTNTNSWTQNNAFYFGQGSTRVSWLAANYSTYFDGYLSRVAFSYSPSTVPTASSFGYLNTEINEWVSKSQAQVKAVVDAGGANSFMLDFDNATSLTTLGYDKSSKGNNWTLNNVSLTAGATYDWMSDVPGNSYATLNPLQPLTTVKPVDGNLSFSSGKVFQSTLFPSSGKFYFEASVTATTPTITALRIGIVGGADYVLYFSTGSKSVNGSTTSYGASWTLSDIIGVAFDCGAGTVEFFKNNVSQGVLTGYNFSGSGAYIDYAGDASGTITGWFNAGQRPFAYTPPAGYKALCQRNLPDPAILNPEKHFDVLAYTGNGGTKDVTPTLFQPDFAWVKSRTLANSHVLSNVIRGANAFLNSNNTNAEGSLSTVINSFLVDGVRLGSEGTLNTNLASGVAWLWKAGGAAVTNTDGSISSQVSANKEAGFSVVKRTGNNTNNATIGHGLGREPVMIVSFQLTSGASRRVWHKNLTAGNSLFLNATDGQTATTDRISAVSSTTYTVQPTGGGGGINSAVDYVEYCFAEIPGFSKAFTYTGNGNADGPYVHLGFKPKFMLIKRADSTGHWQIYDAVRDDYNVMYKELVPSSSVEENSVSLNIGDAIDIVANGFKHRGGTGQLLNTNGGTYIGIAFADVPGKFALAR